MLNLNRKRVSWVKLKEKFAKQLAEVDLSAFGGLLDAAEIFDIQDEIPRDLAPNVICVGANASVRSILDVLMTNKVGHFAQSERPDFFYELMMSCLLMANFESFVRQPQPLLLARRGKPRSGADGRNKSFLFHSSAEKAAIIASIDDFVAGSSLTKPFADRCLMIADELISNALFHAPSNLAGEPMFQHLARHSSVVYPRGVQARAFISHDSNRLLIGCTDPFGSLDRGVLLRKLDSAFGDDGRAEAKSGFGAGLGCRMMIENCTEFYAIVRPKKITMVCCSFSIESGQRAVDTLPKHIHIDVRA